MSTLFSHFFEKINQISPLEHNFTEVLDTIALKPKTLYFYGKLPENVSKTPDPTPSESSKADLENGHKVAQKANLVRPKTVAIVGSRHNTRYGQEIAYKLAYELAKKGVIIVSGLAYGIDSIGHRGCLAAGGITVAILGNPAGAIRPTAHTRLAEQIVANGGAIITEYPPRTTKYKDSPLAPGEYYDEQGHRQLEFRASFLYRNRLISGLSDIVVVVEAAEKSGSLNTATHALEQGKTVFAVPGNITNPYSQGCNKLIKQGALPYTCPDDILRELFPEDYIKNQKKLRQQKLFGDTDVETLILQAVAAGRRSGEDIMRATHLPPEVFNQSVSLLEIKSRLRPLGMNHWGLV